MTLASHVGENVYGVGTPNVKIPSKITLQIKCFRLLRNSLTPFDIFVMQNALITVIVLLEYSPNGMKTYNILQWTWWRHQMKTFSVLLAICAANSPVPGEFPAQRPVTRSFDVFFDLRLNKRLSKQSWGWRFETLSRPLWRHRNEIVVTDDDCYKPRKLVSGNR